MLRERLNEALKQAMRDKETRKVATLRLILAAIKDRDIALRGEEASESDDDALIAQILSKMVKQRNDSIEAYEEAGRCELAEQEREEIKIIQSFLPEPMDDDEIQEACDKVIAEVGAKGLKDIGRCMGELKKRYAGRMDFAKASAIIKDALSDGQ